MTTNNPAATIRNELRAELGVTSRQVSVRSDHGSFSLVIKAPGVKLKDVERIANRQQRIRRCEITGDILQGANTFVSVTFDWKLLEEAAEPIVQWVESIPDDGSRGTMFPVPGNSKLGISRDRNLFRFWEDGRSSRISVGASETAEMIAVSFLEAAKSFDSQATGGEAGLTTECRRWLDAQTPETMSVQPNDPSRVNHLACQKKFFGPHGRYSVVAVHKGVKPGDCGQGSVLWVVEDANSDTGYGPTVIRQADTVEAAVAGIGVN